MKSVIRFCAVAVVAMALTASAFAGECCTKSVAAAKQGKLCEKCAEKSCCKEAVAKAAKAGETKACAACAAKK